MKSFKWYYIAIPAGIIIAYLVLRPSGIKGKPASQSAGYAGYLNGAGAAATGISKLVDSVKGAFGSGSSDSADVSLDGEG